MALPDTTFCLFFRSHPEAACLACDEVGVSYEELLYISEDVFIASAPTRDVGLLQYNLRERQRQSLFRRLFESRQALIGGGNTQVGKLWEERLRLFPDAAAPPNIKWLTERGRAQQRAMGIDPDVKKGRRSVPPRRLANQRAGGGQKASSSRGSEVYRGGGGGGLDEFDTESEEDDLDEFYQPKPPPPAAMSNPRASTRPNSSRASSREAATHQKLVNGRTIHVREAVGVKRNGTPASPRDMCTAMASVFPQPPAGPPPLSTRNPDILKHETQMVKVAKQRLRDYTNAYVTEERAFTAKNSHNRFESREGGGGSGHGRPSSRSSLASSSTAHDDKNRVGDSRSSLTTVVALPAVPDAGKNAQRQLRSLLAVTLTNLASEASLQQKANEEAEEGAAREKRGEFTLSTIQNEYADTPTPGFGFRSPMSARGQHWASRRNELQSKDDRIANQRIALFEEKWSRKREVIDAVEAEKNNPHRLCNEASKIRRVLALERKEGVARAKEYEQLRTIARRSPRFEHASKVREDRRQAAQKNREAHEQLTLYREALKSERDRMVQSKKFDMPSAIRAVWDPQDDTLRAPSLGVRMPVETGLSAVVEGAVARSNALLTGGSVSLADPHAYPPYLAASSTSKHRSSSSVATRSSIQNESVDEEQQWRSGSKFTTTSRPASSSLRIDQPPSPRVRIDSYTAAQRASASSTFEGPVVNSFSQRPSLGRLNGKGIPTPPQRGAWADPSVE